MIEATHGDSTNSAYLQLGSSQLFFLYLEGP